MPPVLPVHTQREGGWRSVPPQLRMEEFLQRARARLVRVCRHASLKHPPVLVVDEDVHDVFLRHTRASGSSESPALARLMVTAGRIVIADSREILPFGVLGGNGAVCR